MPLLIPKQATKAKRPPTPGTRHKMGKAPLWHARISIVTARADRRVRNGANTSRPATCIAPTRPIAVAIEGRLLAPLDQHGDGVQADAGVRERLDQECEGQEPEGGSP